MPSSDAVRFEFGIYVEPEHVDRFKLMVETAREPDSIPLAFEKVIGEYLSCAERGVTPALLNNPIVRDAESGVGVAEVYDETDKYRGADA